MTTEERGSLPQGWVLATIPDLIAADGELTDGDWIESKDQDPDGSVRLTQLADVGVGHFRDRSRRYLTQQKAEELRCTYLKEGDVLVARMPDPLGRACLFPKADQPCVTVVDVCVVRPGEGSVNRRWLMHFINSPQFRAAVASYQSGTTRKRISKKNLSRISLPIPPLQEQARIAEEMDAAWSKLDAAVAGLVRAQANLKRYRASVLQSAVEGRLVPTEAELAREEGRDYEPAEVLLDRILSERRHRWEEAELERLKAKGKPPTNDKWRSKYKEPVAPAVHDLAELPEGWCWTTLDQLTTLITSGSRGWAKYYADEGPVFIRAQDIKTDALRLEKVAHVSPPDGAEGTRTSVLGGDLLVTITGANVTKTAHAPDTLGDAYVSQHVGLCRPLLPSMSPYIHAWVICPTAGRQQLELSAYGAGKPGLNLTNLKELTVAFPPETEQRRIVAEVERQLSLNEDSENIARSVLVRCDQLRQSMLGWAFTGKLVRQDPRDEPADVLLHRLREHESKEAGREQRKRA